MDFERRFRSTELQKIAGVSKINMVHWCNTGLIKPFEDNIGRGSSRVFDWQNLVEVLICRELNRYRVESKAIRWVLEGLRGDRPTPIPNFWALFQKNSGIVEQSHILLTESPIGRAFRSDTLEPVNDFLASAGMYVGTQQEIADEIFRHNSAIYINLPKLIAEAEKTE